MDILRKFLYWVSGLFYKLIPDVYGVLYDLAGARLFQDDTIKNFSTNLYLLVSVVMLFVFGVQLIKAIVNPDLLTDNKKGTAAFIKRAILSVVIITVVPIVFNTMYTVQDKVLENSLIEKIVTGFDGEKNELDVGQFLSASILSELVKPEEDENAKFENATALSTYYNGMLNDSVDKYYDLVGDSITEKYEDANGIEHYSMHYESLAMLVAGIIVCYILVTACMDMALRLVKLSMLQLIAPVSIIAYLVKGDESLNKWLQEVGKTYAIVFLKLATISMVVFGFQKMQDMFEDTTKYSHPWIMRLLIMIGLLTLINELPNLIQSLFGVSFQFKGGIAGRLGNMFGPAGNLAKSAWGKVTSGIGKGAKGLATAGALGLAGLGGALGYAGAKGLGYIDKEKFNGKGAKKLAETGQKFRNLKNSPFGRQVGRAGSVASSTIKAGGGLKGLQEGVKAYKESSLTKDIKNARQNVRDDMAAAQNADVFGIDLANKRSAMLNEMKMANQIDDSNAEVKRQKQLKQQQDRISVARNAMADIEANVRKVHLPKGINTALMGDADNIGLVKVNTTKKVIDEIKNARSNAESGANDLVSRLNVAGHSAEANKLSDLNNSYKKGAITATDYAKALKEDFIDKGLVNKSDVEESIVKHIDQAQSLINENKDLLSNASKITSQQTELNYDQVNGTALNVLSTAIDKKQESAQSVYDNALKQFESDATLTRDIKLTEANIGRVQDDYILETKGNKFDSSSATSVINGVGDFVTNSQPSSQQTSQSQASTNDGYGPEYYPNSYDDFDNYNSQPRAPRPESTGTGTPQPEPTPISNASTPASDNSTPERVVERETVRETNNQNNGPTTLDNVTINASDINAQNLSAQNVNAQGFNANSVDNGHLDQLGLNQEDAIAEQQSDKIVEAIEELNDTIEESNKNNNE